MILSIEQNIAGLLHDPEKWFISSNFLSRDRPLFWVTIKVKFIFKNVFQITSHNATVPSIIIYTNLFFSSVQWLLTEF